MAGHVSQITTLRLEVESEIVEVGICELGGGFTERPMHRRFNPSYNQDEPKGDRGFRVALSAPLE